MYGSGHVVCSERAMDASHLDCISNIYNEESRRGKQIQDEALSLCNPSTSAQKEFAPSCKEENAHPIRLDSHTATQVASICSRAINAETMQSLTNCLFCMSKWEQLYLLYLAGHDGGVGLGDGITTSRFVIKRAIVFV